MAHRHQVNITITPEQVKIARDNYGKMTYAELAKKAGVPYCKMLANLRLLGLYTPRSQQAIVVDMEGYFDVDKFAKYYTY